MPTPSSCAAARPPVDYPVDLDLSGPGRICPEEFGEEAQGADPAPTDLSVSVALREQDGLPPADGALSSARQDFRREVVEAVQSAFATSAAPGTARTYEAALRAVASKVTAKLGPLVLSMSPADVFYAFFSSAVLLGP